MSVLKLNTLNFRNLSSQTIELHPQLNLFIGDNGSGKSSLLEALFFLGHGKSFRTSKSEHLALYDTSNFVVSLKDSNNLQLGLSKNFVTGDTVIKVNGEIKKQLSSLAKNVAVQIVTPESFKIFFGGPKERRKFIELGMFHVKHDFSILLKEFNRILKQRNACVRNKVDVETLNYWTKAFVVSSEKVADYRAIYIEELVDELTYWLKHLLPNIADKIEVHYLKGWPIKKALLDVINETNHRELKLGHTIYGAHKFDVKFLLGKQPIETQLSRGQQKLFLLALTFAQSKLIEQVNRVKPILLIDDIGAELDHNSRTVLSAAMRKIDCQTLLTAIEESVVQPFINNVTVIDEYKKDNTQYHMFHVKHGDILPVNNSVMID